LFTKNQKANNSRLQHLISSYEEATNKQINRNGLFCEDCFLRINFKNQLTVKVPEKKYLSMSRNQASLSTQVRKKNKKMSNPEPFY